METGGISTPAPIGGTTALLKGVAANPSAGSATQVPPGIISLPAGTVLRGNIIKIDGRGNAVLSTPRGDVALQTDLAIKLGSEVSLRITASQQGVKARILTVNGMTPQQYAEKSAIPRGQQIHVDDIVQTGKPPLPPAAAQSTAKAPLPLALPLEEALPTPLPSATAANAQTANSNTTGSAANISATTTAAPQNNAVVQAILLNRSEDLPQLLKLLPTNIPLPAQRLEAGTIFALRILPQTIQFPAASAASSSPFLAATTTTATTTTTTPITTGAPATPSAITPAPTVTPTTPAALPNSPSTTAPAATATTPQTPAATPVINTASTTSTPASPANITPQNTAQATITPTPATSTPSPTAATTTPITPSATPNATTPATTPPQQVATVPQIPTASAAPAQPIASASASPLTPLFSPAPANATAAPTPSAIAALPQVSPQNAISPIPTTTPPPTLSPLPTAPLAQGMIPAQVIGHEQSGETVIRTPLGVMKLDIPTPPGSTAALPVGTEFSLKLDNVHLPQSPSTVGITNALNAAYNSAPLSDHPAPISELSMQWKSLAEAVQVIAQSQPAIAAQILDAVIPAPGPKMAAATLFFVAALRGGDVRQWLGNKAIEALEQAGRGDVVRKLTGEFASLRQMLIDSPNPNWQAIFVPVFDGQLQQARLFIKKEPPETSKAEGGGTRFIMEVELSRMGPMQFDGLVRKKGAKPQFDLIIRSREMLAPEHQQNIREIYQASSELTGFSGGIGFQVNNPFPTLPMRDILSDSPDVMA